MSRQEFVDKWANHLSGKFTRFAFCDTSGPGVADRTRNIVKDIEKAVATMYDEMFVKQKPKEEAPTPLKVAR